MNFSLPYSTQLQRILSYSKEEARRLNNSSIKPEHLMLGIMRDGQNRAFDILSHELNVDIQAYRKNLEQEIEGFSPSSASLADIDIDEETNNILRLGMLEAKMSHNDTICPEHVLLGFMRRSQSPYMQFLNQQHINYDKVKDLLTPKVPQASSDFDLEDEEDEDDMPPLTSRTPQSGGAKASETQTSTKQKKGSDTPAIDTFSIDFTQAAREGKLDPVVGREKEIERISQILSRRKKNNPVLIGEPGVGKSAIVEGLAMRIVERKVSRLLFDKRVVALDLTNIVAGTKYRGQFEERMRSIINELRENPDIIVFIDEIHELVGAGNPSGQMDAANILKPALARGELQCIGATTLEEYRKSIEKDGALERRFQKILVDPTTQEETEEILRNLKSRYEQHHNVLYTDEAIKACVSLAQRYMTDRAFPDKAIDVLDEVGSRAHVCNISAPKEIEEQEAIIDQTVALKEAAVKSQDYEKAANYRDREKELRDELAEMRRRWEESGQDSRITIEAQDVAETVSIMTGVPVTKMAGDENVRLRGMREALKRQVIAQDPAIDKLVNAILRSRIGLKDPNRPIGTFMFLGPTGVGKTYLAKKLAEHMFGSSDALVRIDMSEYMEKFTVSRLVGAPPGYVGYEEGGMLTEKVRRKPYSIVLLDEIEKAHADVFNILLQVMDDGRLTDSNGRTVDFRNTVIIMTSNVGTRQLKDFGRGVGFSAMDGLTDQQVSRSVIQKALNKQFSPEFLNRIDEIITFDQLSQDTILQIVDIELQGLLSRIDALGYHLQLPDDVRRFVGKKGYDPQFGARPLRRAISQHIEDPLAALMVENDIKQGDIISAYIEADTVKLRIEK